jgi:uncharacterized membrane protein
MTPAADPDPQEDVAKAQDDLRTWGTVSYVLHAIVAIGAVLPGAQASVGLLLVAFLLDLVKRDEATGTWQASHYRWRIRSVLAAGLLYLLAAPLWLLLIIPGWLAYAAISIWFLYRVIRGWTRFNDKLPMPIDEEDLA